MKIYTQEEFDALPSIHGFKDCPTGDYSGITNINQQCRFGASCKFGDFTVFGGYCIFSNACTFGKSCSFGERCFFCNSCEFGKSCTFGSENAFCKSCIFGESCTFGRFCNFSSNTFDNLCKFGDSCKFDDFCKFGASCRFGDSCKFGESCSFESGHKAKTTRPFLAIAGAGSEGRTSYFFDFVDGIFVRSGCFFGTLEQFRDRVVWTCPDETDIKRLQYLGFSNIVAATFGGDII